MRTALLAFLTITAAGLVATSSAQALAPCPTVPVTSKILTGQGALESIAFDPSGRLLYTEGGRKALMRIDKPGAKPRVLASGIESPGGIAFDTKGHAFVGYGNSLANGGSPAKAGAGIFRVD